MHLKLQLLVYIYQAAYGWDDDTMKERGLGDYRIPKTMLTEVDGTRIPVEDIIDSRGFDFVLFL